MSAYKINGTKLLLQPTAGRWKPRESLGIDGNGHPVYPGIREYELRWDLMTAAHFAQLHDFYLLSCVTGSVVVDLPMFASGVYGYYSYSGCTLSEPEAGDYFEEHLTEVVLIVRKISTTGTE